MSFEDDLLYIERKAALEKGKKSIRSLEIFTGWVVMDSNHRRHSQQIYSLPHLATLVTTLIVGVDGFEPPTLCL